MKILKETSTSEYIYKLCISSYKQVHKKGNRRLSIYLCICIHTFIYTKAKQTNPSFNSFYLLGKQNSFHIHKQRKTMRKFI